MWCTFTGCVKLHFIRNKKKKRIIAEKRTQKALKEDNTGHFLLFMTSLNCVGSIRAHSDTFSSLTSSHNTWLANWWEQKEQDVNEQLLAWEPVSGQIAYNSRSKPTNMNVPANFFRVISANVKTNCWCFSATHSVALNTFCCANLFCLCIFYGYDVRRDVFDSYLQSKPPAAPHSWTPSSRTWLESTGPAGAWTTAGARRSAQTGFDFLCHASVNFF